ncbi:MAG TPA: CUAEP/CCAEP-tail radical SAM protein, partial [Candidatus Solibacter sp.]
PVLQQTNCAFVTSAIESLDDAVLVKLAKGHTRADFLEALALMRAAGLSMSPTFIPFHPWTTLASYRDFLRTLVDCGLTSQITPIQLAIRLLIPEGSLLMELPEVRQLVGLFDARALYYPWHNPDPALDRLCATIQETIKREEKHRTPRAEIFRQIWDLAGAGEFPDVPMADRATIPYLTEPWYC